MGIRGDKDKIEKMRHIKTFESFQEDDMTTVIASFLDKPVERIKFDPIHRDTSMFQGYKIESTDTEGQALEALEEYIRTEKNLMPTFIKASSRARGESDLLFLTEKPLAAALVEWLDTNWSKLEKAESQDRKGFTLYRLEPRKNIIVCDPKENKAYVDFDSVISFFSSYFDIPFKDNTFIKEWLDECYGIGGDVHVTFAPFLTDLR